MKRIFTIIAFAFTGIFAVAQETVDFEDFGLSPGEHLDGSDGTMLFTPGFINLPINYDTMFSSWTGWAISASTDNQTEGYLNQFGSITGGGADASNTFAVSFNFIPNSLYFESQTGEGPIVSHNGVFITNSTYTYLSMLNGDSFAKKFGGIDGTDPDYHLLTIKGLNNEGEQDSVEFYLADYRSNNSADDYIIDEWTFVDLSKFQYGPELTFELTTTDIGVYGPNTPSYFCIDNFTFDVISSAEDESFAKLKVYPNPAYDVLNIEFEEIADIKIVNANGQIVLSSITSNNQINISGLTSGVFNLIVTTDKGNATRRFIKM